MLALTFFWFKSSYLLSFFVQYFRLGIYKII